MLREAITAIWIWSLDGSYALWFRCLNPADFAPLTFQQRRAMGHYRSLPMISSGTGFSITQSAAKKNGLVRVQFLSAEVTRNGATIVEPHPPALPFTLPTQTGYIRLVYLVRVSEADHNMAIIASRRPEALNVFTKQFEKNPNACATSNEVFCAWVPAGIALRPEKGEAAR
jgi:hypothetical protein